MKPLSKENDSRLQGCTSQSDNNNAQFKNPNNSKINFPLPIFNHELSSFVSSKTTIKSLEELFPGTQAVSIHYRRHPKYKRNHEKNETYIVHSLKTLPELFIQLTDLYKSESEDNENHFVLRYIVQEGNAWFAKEGTDFAHYRMTGALAKDSSCMAAGNLFFSKDFKELIAINHESGDFEPQSQSMKWLLIILFINKKNLHFNFLDSLKIKCRQPSHTYTFSINEIEQWVKNINPKICAPFLNQPQMSKIVDYSKISSETKARQSRLGYTKDPELAQQLFASDNPIPSSVPANTSNHDHVARKLFGNSQKSDASPAFKKASPNLGGALQDIITVNNTNFGIFTPQPNLESNPEFISQRENDETHTPKRCKFNPTYYN